MKEYPVKLYDVLMHPENNPGGWLYLPPTDWDLNTEGLFADDEGNPSQNEEDDIPVKAKEDGWIDVLESADITDIIDFMKRTNPDPTPEQRLEAFIYYWENDAFYEED